MPYSASLLIRICLGALLSGLTPLVVAKETLRCPDSLPPTQVQVSIKAITTDVRRSVGIEEITEKAQAIRPGKCDGMAFVKLALPHQLVVHTAPSSKSGTYCATFDLRVSIEAPDTRVYLAKELEPTDCRLRAVFAHEMRHLMAAQKAMDRAGDSLKKNLSFNEPVVLLEDNAESVISQMVSQEIKSASKIFDDYYEELNKDVDSEEEGERLGAQCRKVQFLGDGKSDYVKIK